MAPQRCRLHPNPEARRRCFDFSALPRQAPRPLDLRVGCGSGPWSSCGTWSGGGDLEALARRQYVHRVVTALTRDPWRRLPRSEEHTSELQSRPHLVCRLLLEKKKDNVKNVHIGEKKNQRRPTALSPPFSCFLLFFFFFFNDTATTEIYTLSLHDALPILRDPWRRLP